MNKIKSLAIIFSGVFFLTASLAVAQSETQDQDLEAKYRDLIETSETFQQYKVIPITKLNNFEKQLVDTLQKYNEQIQQAERQKLQAQQTADSLRAEVLLLSEELEETKEQVDAILFFDIPMTKTAYNVMLWTIVGILIIGLVLVYLLYLNSQRVTKQSKQDKERLDNELEELRKSSHEKQVKIKRELQTALNKLEEQNR